MEDRICKGCGDRISDFRSAKALFCSKACQEKYYRVHRLYYHRTIVCPACGTTFDSYKYRQTCSKECAYKWREMKKKGLKGE